VNIRNTTLGRVDKYGREGIKRSNCDPSPMGRVRVGSGVELVQKFGSCTGRRAMDTSISENTKNPEA
jgi:hypothetical protein